MSVLDPLAEIKMFTREEGGQWLDIPPEFAYSKSALFDSGDAGPLKPFTANTSVLVSRDGKTAIAVHSLMFSDGREWDVLNGWREPVPVTKAPPAGSEYFAHGVVRGSDETLTLAQPNSLDHYVEQFYHWGNARGLIQPYNIAAQKSQFIKVAEEVGEIAAAVARGKPPFDAIGDTLVTLTLLAANYDLSLTDCAEQAWSEISTRKGNTVNGIFIKEED